MNIARKALSRLLRVSNEHLRKVEKDITRPSPELLKNLLFELEAPEELQRQAHMLLVLSHIPEALRDTVEIHPPGAIRTAVDTTVEWFFLLHGYEIDEADKKCLLAEVQRALEVT